MRHVVLLLMLASSCATANGALPGYCERMPSAAPQDYGVFVGSYQVIGRRPDSERTFSGHVSIDMGDAALSFHREIRGSMVTGRGYLAQCLADQIPILFLEFKENGINVEELCQSSFDMDNYKRMTCVVRRGDHATKRPGLEAYFADHEHDR